MFVDDDGPTAMKQMNEMKSNKPIHNLQDYTRRFVDGNFHENINKNSFHPSIEEENRKISSIIFRNSTSV